jgi:hypothetical protein
MILTLRKKNSKNFKKLIARERSSSLTDEVRALIFSYFDEPFIVE